MKFVGGLLKSRETWALRPSLVGRTWFQTWLAEDSSCNMLWKSENRRSEFGPVLRYHSLIEYLGAYLIGKFFTILAAFLCWYWTFEYCDG